MVKRDIVVIGSSAGGVVALQELVARLPADCMASFFVVQHVSANGRSILPTILSHAGPLKAKHPHDGEPIAAGMIYVAPPDHHLLLEDKHILIKRGPKENRFRPSIDALFRSAAYTFGSRVIGVVLTGLLDDGTSGMWSIKRQGGVGIIQEPEEALYPSMPRSVLEYVDVDYQLPISEIGPLLYQLTAQPAPTEPEMPAEEADRFKTELRMAAQQYVFDSGFKKLGPPTLLTCPECHGALVSIKEGKLERFRCHTGHAFTASDLLAEISKATEDSLWNTIRGLEEAIMILEQAAKSYDEADNSMATEVIRQKIQHIKDQTGVIREIIVHSEQLSVAVASSKQVFGQE